MDFRDYSLKDLASNIQSKKMLATEVTQAALDNIDKYDGELFLNLQRLSIEKPELVEVFIDSNGEIEFEIEFDFFFSNLESIFGF